MLDRSRRDAVRERLLALAADAPEIVGAALTGSAAAGAEDAWSDIDLALGVDDQDLGPTLARWTAIMVDKFGAVHHWDLPSGSWVYRVFLLPDLLEVDLGFAPAADWGPRADSWRTVFGDPVDQRTVERADRSAYDLRSWTGHAWHHLLHGRIAIERGQGLQAAYWIGAARDLVIESACRRRGLPTAYNKGAHRLPAELVAAAETTLVASTGETELRRALDAVSALVMDELRVLDPDAAGALEPVLRQG